MQQGPPPCLLPVQAEGVWAFPARSAGESSPPRDKTVAAGGVVMYRYGTGVIHILHRRVCDYM